MGGCTFMSTGKGATAREAFNSLVEDARHEYGHGGYTGTIAEKSSFTMIQPPFTPNGSKEGRLAIGEYAQGLLDKNDRRVDDKYGPAGCIDLGDGSYLFFGWATE